MKECSSLSDSRSYTKAIEVSEKRDPVFFANRAACELSSCEMPRR